MVQGRWYWLATQEQSQRIIFVRYCSDLTQDTEVSSATPCAVLGAEYTAHCTA